MDDADCKAVFTQRRKAAKKQSDFPAYFVPLRPCVKKIAKRFEAPLVTLTLRWDLCGIILGTLFSCIMLRTTQTVPKLFIAQR